MWFPEIFQRIQQGGSSCGGGSSLNETKSIWSCSHQVEFGTSVYMESFLIALSNLPGNIVTVLVINKLGRRQLLGDSLIKKTVDSSILFLSNMSGKKSCN